MAAVLEFQVLLDDPDAGRIVRAGNWVHTLICDRTGRVQVCEWTWDPLGDYADSRNLELNSSRR